MSFPLHTAITLTVIVSMLAGCSGIGGYAGAVGGVAAAGASANPAVGIGVGIALRAGVDALFDAIFRHMKTGEQDRLAAQAGSLPVGQRAPWIAKQIWPLPDKQGDMQVVSDIDNPLSPCRVVLFSALTKKQRTARQANNVPLPSTNDTGAPGAVPPVPAPAGGTTSTTLSVQWFQTTVCKRSDGKWKWAQAEPATERWGNLQ